MSASTATRLRLIQLIIKTELQGSEDTKQALMIHIMDVFSESYSDGLLYARENGWEPKQQSKSRIGTETDYGIMENC